MTAFPEERRMRLNLFIALAFLVAPPALAPAFADDPIPDLDYHAVLLVRDFDSGGDFPELGRLAAEAVTLALEKDGLARVVRPVYLDQDSWELDGPVIEVEDAADLDVEAGERSVDVFVDPRRLVKRREVSAPESDYLLEGRAVMADKAWRITATLLKRATNEPVLVASSAEADAKEGLFTVADRLVAQLARAFGPEVLERRAEAIRRAVVLQLMDRAVALDRLREMNRRRPGILAPAAVAFLLTSETHPAADPAVMEWRAKVVSLLPQAGPAGVRLLMRLGLDPGEFREKPSASE
jgi:hypothetical protein